MKLNSKSIYKYLSIGIVSVLSLCGIAFIILSVNIITGGTDESHSLQRQARHDLLQLDEALIEFNLDLNQYSLKLSDLYNDTGHSMWMGPYIKEKNLKDPWGELYHYLVYQERNGYQLYTLGKDKKVGGSEHDFDQISDGSLKLIESKK